MILKKPNGEYEGGINFFTPKNNYSMRKDQSRSIKTCSGFGNNDQRAVSPLYIPSNLLC